MGKFDGGCLCGAVTYTSADEEPAMVAICHCNDCQKQSGAAFSTNVLVSRDGFAISGDTKTYETVGTGTGQPRKRVFCPECGSPVLTELAEMPDLVALKAGTLDDRETIAPELELWTKRKQGWVSLGEERGCFETDLET